MTGRGSRSSARRFGEVDAGKTERHDDPAATHDRAAGRRPRPTGDSPGRADEVRTEIARSSERLSVEDRGPTSPEWGLNIGAIAGVAAAALLVVVGATSCPVAVLAWPSAPGLAGPCAGLACLVGAWTVAAGAMVRRGALRARPVDGRLGEEPAPVLRRDPRPTRVSSWALAGLGAVLLLVAVLATTESAWGLAVVLGTSGGPGVERIAHRRDLAGGLWLTGSGVRHDYRGRRWEWRGTRSPGSSPVHD